MLLSELLAVNVSLKDQLTKIDLEIVAKLAELQAAIDKLTQQLGDVVLTAEQVQSITDLQSAVDALDNLNPDSIESGPEAA